MATIMCLSEEIVAIILGYKDISIEDIINLRLTCKKFRKVIPIQYNMFWEQKFSQRWHSAKKFYDKQSEKNGQKYEPEDKRSLNFIETGIKCTRKLRGYVSQIIYKHYYDYRSFYDYDIKSINSSIKLKDVFHLDRNLTNNLDGIINNSENFIKYFFIDEIKNLLTQSPRIGCDLTKNYCNEKILHYIRECFMRKRMEIFLKKPDTRQLLERAATMAAQSIQPQRNVFYPDVKASLNSIAEEVLNCLKKKYPDHSIFSTPVEYFSYWKNNNIGENYWDEAEGTQIMNILEEYLFGELNFRPSNLKDTNLDYMCIDTVLKNKYGQKIILLIIYESVARRLGICCYLRRRSPYHSYNYCIFWKPKYVTRKLENARILSISCKKFPNCLVNQQFSRTLYYRGYFHGAFLINAAKLWKEMNKLVAYLTNQHTKPFDIFLHEYEYVINRKVVLCFKKTEQIDTRPKDVKYAVGMIVKHDIITSSCVGVIIGWHRYVDTHVMFRMSKPDKECSSNLYLQHELPLCHCLHNFIRKQTNYLILTENNKMCYVAEDVITLTTPKWIDNSEIGRYFCKFEDTHYVPNEMLARLYPHDAVITAQTTISENYGKRTITLFLNIMLLIISIIILILYTYVYETVQ